MYYRSHNKNKNIPIKTPRQNELTRNWLLLLSASLGVICSSIVLPFYSLGALVVPITEEFGWSRAEFQLALLFSTGTGVITAPVVGWLLERVGARLMAISGLIGLAIALASASLVDGQLWMLYACYTAMALLGAGTIPVTWTRAVTSLFFEQRGLALGIMLSGTGICAIIIPQYTVWMIEHFGWRTAYLGLAALPIVIAGPLVFLFFKPGEDIEAAPEVSEANQTGYTFFEATRGYRFWVLLLSIFLVYIAMSGMVPNLIPALTDQGISAQKAATAISVFGVAVIAGRLIVGYLVDKIWAPGVAAVAIGLPVIGSLILAGAPGFFIACVAAAMLGFAAGAELDLMSFLAAKYFGLKHYPQIYAVLYSALALASGVAPMLFARVFDVTGSYEIGFLVGAGFFAIGAGMILLMGRYPTRRPSQ
ncbi:MAG: MFS transporter [Pseudomonadales bacterium]|nr:MFS transporter [Pseudomonadales bacterium]